MRSAYLCKEKIYIRISVLVHMFSVKLHDHTIFNSVSLTFPAIPEGKQEDFPGVFQSTGNLPRKGYTKKGSNVSPKS